MSPERQLEIARKLLVHEIMTTERPFANFCRDLGNTAKAIDERVDTLREFALETILPQVVEGMIGVTNVSITVSDPVIS